MTRSIRPEPVFRRPLAATAAVLAALALAGCSSTHVGESWQCPLDQGGSCTSVAGADPAVPARAGEAMALPAPLYRVWAEAESARPRDTARAEEPCETECGPFAWLARLFGTDTDAEAPESAAARSAARPVVETPLPLPANGEPALGDPDPGDTADDDPAAIDEPASRDLAGDDLREPEFVGRIWIAPFVDADGIYREGAYVRLVIAPARWRLP